MRRQLALFCKSNIFKHITIKSGIWYLFSDFFLNGLSFITIPIFTRLLSVSDYGVVSIFSTYVGLFTIIVGFNLYAGHGRALIDFKEKYNSYLSSVLGLSFIVFIIFVLLAYVNINTLVLSTRMSSHLIYLALITAYASFVFAYYLNNLIFKQQYKLKSLLSIIKPLLETVLAFILIIFLFNNDDQYLGRIYSIVFVSCAFMILCIYFITKNSKIFIDIKPWIYAIKFGFPLIPHSVSHLLLVQFDRIAIQSLVGSTEVGLYSFAYNIGMIPLVIQGAVVAAWSPWLFRSLEHGHNDSVKSVALIITELFLLVVVFVVMIGPELSFVFAPEAYQKSSRIISVISLAYFYHFMYMVFVGFAFFKKQTYMISLGTVIAGVVNAILNLKLIPVLGYEIAAWTTVFSYFLLFLFHWYNVEFILKIKIIPFRKMIQYGTICSLLVFITYSTNNLNNVFLTATRIRYLLCLIVMVTICVSAVKRVKTLIRS